MMSPAHARRGRGGAVATAFLAITGLTGVPIAACAGSARDYLNAPVDMWLTFSNSAFSRSVTPQDGLDVSSRLRSEVFSQTAIVTRTVDVLGRTGGISAIIPYATIDVNAAGSRFSNEGFSDLGVMLQTNIFGGPALSREQFRSFVPQPFSSFHLIVLAPTGKYDAENPVNPSSNRWTFFPTINYSYTPDRGWTWLEIYASTEVFTVNPAFAPGGSKLTQDPLYLLEFHASRNLVSKLWLSADAYYSYGGETRIDGVAQGNSANTLRLGAGAGVTVWAGGDIMLNYEKVVAKPAGQPEARTFRLKLRQAW
jgi:hypothetical protein